jgi:hypothetical protein
MAYFGTAVSAGRVIAATNYFTDAVALLHNFTVFSGVALKTGTLTIVAASARMATFGSTAIACQRHILVTSNFYLVIAPWYGACDKYHATDRGKVLGLPAFD